ncbi:class II aldolase/adducin family protein [Streptomyces sp. NPDC051704]|uniref:class II aldolase/adducin family protein n=1 Tax=Streptomyces sp. NPDC051704 TaxID=3365671 RepID=UPI00378C38FB
MPDQPASASASASVPGPVPARPPAPAPVPVDRLRFALPPVHTDPAEERAYRKERLAGALRLFGRLGYEDGVAGHITVRDPEFADCHWVNPFGQALSALGADDLLLVDGDGRVRRGARRVNELAFAVHAAVHRARPDAVAVVHAHAPYGRALAALGELLAPISEEACAFYEDHALLDGFAGPQDAVRIARALGPYKALVLRNRGMLTVGDSVDAAAWWFIAAERAAQVQLIARAAGKPAAIDHRAALAARERFGSDLAAWVSYQPLWQTVAP